MWKKIGILRVKFIWPIYTSAEWDKSYPKALSLLIAKGAQVWHPDSSTCVCSDPPLSKCFSICGLRVVSSLSQKYQPTFFSIWRKCCAEIKHFPPTLVKTCTAPCAAVGDHFLPQWSYCHGCELAGTETVVSAAPLGRLGAAWILGLLVPQSSEGF